MDWFGKEFTKKTRVPVEASNHRAQMKLRLAVEVTKKSLSASTSAPCSVESLAEGMDFHGTINRTRFDLLASSLYSRIVSQVQQAIEQANLDPLNIHEVILVGGTTKLPTLANKLLDFLPESVVVSNQIEADEVLAKGGALQVKSLQAFFPPEDATAREQFQQSLSNPAVCAPEALARPIGFVLEPELAGEPAKLAFVTLMEQATPLPARRIVDIPVETDAKSEVIVALWEGEHYVKVTAPESKVEKAKGAVASAVSGVFNAVKNATGGANGEDEDEFSDEEEEEDIRTAEVRATKAISDLVVPVNAAVKDAKVRVTIEVNKGGKGTISAHQLVDGAKTVEKSF